MKQSDTVNTIKGVGEKTAQMFAKLSVNTVYDLIHHYPRDYEQYTLPVAISSLREGTICTIEASIVQISEIKKIKNLSLISCTVRDPSGTLRLTWYNQNYLIHQLHMGYRYIIRGKAVRQKGTLSMEQPKLYTKEEYRKYLSVLSPVYPLTKGLTNNAVAKAMKAAFMNLEDLQEYLPARLLKQHRLLKERDALFEIHFPKDMECMREARRTLVFREFLLFALFIRSMGEEKQRTENRFVITEQEETRQLFAELPYTLTNDQQTVYGEIMADMAGKHTMSRLIQGDVGSGKTILAVMALLNTVKCGYQGALMVPTEVLAAQHYESFTKLLKPYGIRISLLTGSVTAAGKRAIYEDISEQRTDIVIGTHALLQEKVVYAKLALVITDEQHRFGVKQREALSKKGAHPHILVMSATPIPRSLAMIVYGDLDISIIKELPKNRLPIKNCVVDTGYREKAYEFIVNQAKEGHQSFIICPMVEESEAVDAENVTAYTEQLKNAIGSQVKIALLHGRMHAAEKTKIMERFANGEIQVLVSTTVIEVGINVPNATVMMVENAERFGLAQLHQLRGRIGRGSAQGYTIFVCGSGSEEAKARLQILKDSNDGFQIAAEDLRLRGPGDLFGIRQSGDMEFRLGDIYQDAETLKEASEAINSLTEAEREALKETVEAKRAQMYLQNPAETI